MRWVCPGRSDFSLPFFFSFVVLEFHFWLSESVSAPSGASHSLLSHLWSLTVVLLAPIGMAHLKHWEGTVGTAFH